MRLTVLVLLLIFFAWGEESSYKPGEGVQVGSLPLYAGGYFSLNYKQNETMKQFSIDDLALLAYGDSGKFSYLAEIEASDLYVRNLQPENNHTSDTRFHAERLYLNYDFNDDNALRVGKFNSPIGFWNLSPINVLRDTTSSPISTEILFPKYTTGVNLAHHVYTVSEDTINLMLQETRDLDAIFNSGDVYNNFDIDRHYGLGLIHSEGEWKFQFNAGRFQTMEPKSLYYLMASVSYENESFKLLSEIGSQHDNNSFTVPYAGYLQGVYRLTPQHSLIARLEAYKDHTLDQKEAFGVFGYTYRPIYPVALKAEYQSHSSGHEDQFLCSFSVLF
ncbi:MAG: hypothetical protein PF439_07930 [Helicobacteraceae bacterium]|jgi:hypothetical protein|nr:hypothetical protein [Helicobacteraceae bacterium]